MRYPSIQLLPGQDRRLRAGHPWAYSNELRMDAEAKALPPGEPVCLLSAERKPLAIALFNPHSLIAARIVTRNKDATIDAAFVERRLARALHLRERLFDRPCYRLVHAEADGLPGLVIDRFADLLVCQLNSAGIARLEPAILEALDRLLAPRVVVLRNDSPVRELEGLDQEVRIAKGALDGAAELVENGLTYLIDPLEGQKTGWYYDQCDNRAFVARLARDQEVLDLYSYSAGFGLLAAAAGARGVLAIDRSQSGLDLAQASAVHNDLAARLEVVREDAFAALDRLAADKRRFGIVVADPPAFVRNKRELKPGLRGYRKLARACAAVVAEEGVLAIACCSHNVPEDAFADEVRRGLRDAGRPARLIRQAGAAPDHPVHPALPESAYLKCNVYMLD
ncbi:MAG TPA: class I SAM-dependent rRNA methyltransferase [Geminicoccaceae bacterium]|nr:class I SAM-dependent rRNA methyltransferase [Geminicoccaceae bacterium]